MTIKNNFWTKTNFWNSVCIESALHSEQEKRCGIVNFTLFDFFIPFEPEEKRLENCMDFSNRAHSDSISSKIGIQKSEPSLKFQAHNC